MSDNKVNPNGTKWSEYRKTIFSKDEIEECDLKVSSYIEKIKTRSEDQYIPIDRFNCCEANKIFDEVNESGIKIVMENEAPACVLIKPEWYEEMLEKLQDYELCILKRQTHENYGK